MLHDVGVLVDYNDHHKHGYYLILNAGLPGFAHRELALIALLVRAHRKALPSLAPLEGVLDGRGRGPARAAGRCLRIAEQLERGRARASASCEMQRPRRRRCASLVRARATPPSRSGRRPLEAAVVERAFGRRLELGRWPRAQPPAALTR